MAVFIEFCNHRGFTKAWTTLRRQTVFRPAGRDPEAERSKNGRLSTNNFSTISARKRIEQPVIPRFEPVAC